MYAVIRRITSVILITVIVAVPGVVFWQHQNIFDWWRLRGYIPPPRIAELASHTTMTGHGQKLFYVHRPELNDRDAFNRNCSGFEQTIVLGCYVNRRAIFIFDVTDPRLEGIEEVTAAHEMLHAGYDRLSKTERQKVDRMTIEAFNALNDERIKKVMRSYENRDQSVVPNELHSILATEVRSLPLELEEYYKRFFTNRSAVVEFSEKYEAVFTAQQNRIKALGKQIADMESELKRDKQRIDELEAELDAESDRLNSLRSEGRTQEYNAAVPGYNAKVNEYRTLVSNYNSKVRQLNSLVQEYNSLAVEQKQLTDAINSKQQGF